MSAREVAYRDSSLSDLPALVALDALCFAPGVAYPKRLMRFFVEHRASHTIVAEREGRVVGFVIARAARDAGEIVTIDVAPEMRRSGVGAELMKRAETSMKKRGAEVAYLEVDQANEPALRMYERFGYTVLEEYVEESGTPRYLMMKALSS